MIKTFNKVRYIELLKKEKTFKNEWTDLSNQNNEESLELFYYGVILENQIYYNRKVEYTYLVEEYLRNNAGEAGASIFQWDFFSLFQKNKKSASFGNYGRGHSKTRYFFYWSKVDRIFCFD